MEQIVTSATGEQATWTDIENIYIKNDDTYAYKNINNETTDWLWMNYDSWGLTAGQKPISLTGLLRFSGASGFSAQLEYVSLGVSGSPVGTLVNPNKLVAPYLADHTQAFNVESYDHTTIDTVQVGYKFQIVTFSMEIRLYYQLAYLVYEDPDEPNPFCILRAKMLNA